MTSVITPSVPHEPVIEPREIEAGDVFHDASAAARDLACAGHELDAEHEIARRAERR